MVPTAPRSRRRALVAYALSVLVLSLSLAVASSRYPGGFDWAYTVLSALASRKHNPEGAPWFAAGLALALLLLWPAASWIAARERPARGLARFGVRALRLGIALGVLVGLERLAFFHFSALVRKGHELLALGCFLSTYAGVLALHVHRLRRRRATPWPTALALSPLVAVGASQLALYLDQRDLGWVGPDWRELGVPVWLSFAFWQWLAVAALWGSIGQLAFARRERPPAPSA